jgi:hypothetical protein
MNVYHTLLFIIPALQSENYNKKSKLKYHFRSNLSLIVDIEMVNCFSSVAIINRVLMSSLFIIVQNVGEFIVT